MFKQNVVACIKVNGRILRESGDLVTLPFGCEYSILIKNLESVRAQVSVSVDGKDTAGRLVIAPNSSLELERFIKNGNLETGNRFRFIERTAEIEAHRGISSDDGLIRIEAWKELIKLRIPVPRAEYYDDPYPVPISRPWPIYPPRWPPPPRRPIYSGAACLRSTPVRAQMMARGASVRPASSMNFVQSDAGITVPGSQSNQRFVSVSGFPLEPQSIVIVLRLRGEVAGKPVSQPVTVEQKPKCETCGKQNKADAQYCSKCGTALVLYA